VASLRGDSSLLLTKAAAIRDPFEESLFLMVQLPYLQPFVDVTKRTSRLAANILWRPHGYTNLTPQISRRPTHSRFDLMN
jgi:hypothetical protein